MQTSISIAELERELVRRILALDGSAYDQGARKGEWREASVPLSVVQEPQSIGHLTFNVFAEAARNATLERDVAPGGFVKLATDVAVLFAYHVRPASDGTQLEDQRAASDAARDVARAVLALPQNLFVSLPVALWRPSVTTDGEWMLVRLDFLCVHDLALS